MEGEEWRVESGEWRVESGVWRVESGVWRVEMMLGPKCPGFFPFTVILERSTA